MKYMQIFLNRSWKNRNICAGCDSARGAAASHFIDWLFPAPLNYGISILLTLAQDQNGTRNLRTCSFGMRTVNLTCALRKHKPLRRSWKGRAHTFTPYYLDLFFTRVNTRITVRGAIALYRKYNYFFSRPFISLCHYPGCASRWLLVQAPKRVAPLRSSAKRYEFGERSLRFISEDPRLQTLVRYFSRRVLR